MQLGYVKGSHDGRIQSFCVDDCNLFIEIIQPNNLNIKIKTDCLKSYIFDRLSDSSVVQTCNIFSLVEFVFIEEYIDHVKYLEKEFGIQNIADSNISEYLILFEFVNGECVFIFFENDLIIEHEGQNVG